MSIEKAIEAVDAASAALCEAVDALERAAEEEFRLTPPHAILALKRSAAEFSTRLVRAAVAEKRRPKGPTVQIEWTGRGLGRGPVSAEVIRRTATQVFVLRSDWSSLDSFKVADGTPSKRGWDDYLGHWRVQSAYLDAIREMPVGENVVSRALKAANRIASEENDR